VDEPQALGAPSNGCRQPLASTAKRRNVTAHRKTITGLFYGGFALNLFIAFIPGRTMWNLFLG
jgi:uncharacterized membrane protein